MSLTEIFVLGLGFRRLPDAGKVEWRSLGEIGGIAGGLWPTDDFGLNLYDRYAAESGGFAIQLRAKRGRFLGTPASETGALTVCMVVSKPSSERNTWFLK